MANIEINKYANIISWTYKNFFQAYLKTCNEYKSLKALNLLYKPYINTEIYMGVICLIWIQELRAKISEFKQLSLWNRAYGVETYLSALRIKINEQKLKNFDDNNELIQKVYENLQNSYVVQQYNGTDKLTGRMYVKNSKFSLQTLSKTYREIIVAEKDCILIEFDYNYFEYFLLSQICNYKLQGDPHIHISKLIFGDELHRQQGKTINYAVLYGQSIEKTILELNLGEQEEKLTILFNEIIKPVEPLKLRLIEEYKEKGYFYNYFGRQIFPEKEHACLSNYISSTATDLFIIKLEKIIALLQSYPTINKIVLQNHDSVLLNLDIQTVEETTITEDIKTILESPEDGIYGEVDFKYGINWKDLD